MTRFGPRVVAVVLAIVAVYTVYPWLCRRTATKAETAARLPGDEVVPDPTSGYTLAVSIAAAPSEVWPWLVQMGQGRAGFYTYEWVENLIGADIHNADRIIPDLQGLRVGDRIRLTPDPYMGGPGQYIVVAHLDSPNALVFRQELPTGGIASWAYVLQQAADGSTRLVFRRRGTQPSVFDRIMMPGYYFMDRGMLAGIKDRAERRL